jgi:hypothetical protein
MYRQGDILIVAENRKSVSNTKVKEDNVVAYGETTGHSHRVENGTVLVGQADSMYIEAGKKTKLVHDEHDEIKIPEGFYRVIRQREFDGENIRTVID